MSQRWSKEELIMVEAVKEQGCCSCAAPSSKNKVIAITGGATGIGRACVLKFLQEGYSVSFCDINDDEAHSLIEEAKAIDPNGSHIFYHHANTTVQSELKEWVAGTISKFGHLDAVFANAGIHRSNTMMNIAPDELKLMIDTNIYGTIWTLQECVPELQKNGGGSIVINCSDQFFIGKGNNFGYGLTKGALGQITRSLSVDLAKDKIRVNAVCPGTIRTPLAEKALGRWAERAGITMEEAWAEEDSLFTLGRCGTSEEVAEMVYFLTEKATFSTGGHYLVDGGICAH